MSRAAAAPFRAALRRWRYLPSAAKMPLWRIGLAPLEAFDWLRGRPRLGPPRWLRLLVGGDFEATGSEYLGYFVRLAGLAPTEAVLDIGCGSGRIALPLTRYLRPPGRYDGFDIVAPAVRWCQRHITRDHPHFRFSCLDVRNDRYSPRGSVEASRARFPYDDASFDFAFAASLFTHLAAEECVRYLAETRRVLCPGGRALLTFFLIDADWPADPPAGAPGGVAFGRSASGVATLRDRPGDPHFAVAYDEALVGAWIAGAGLTLVGPVLRGTWRKPFESEAGASAPRVAPAGVPAGATTLAAYQDIILVRREARGEDQPYRSERP